MPVTRRLAILAMTLVNLLFAASTANAAPALWVVRGPHATVYLFGTVHILPKDRPWRTPAIDKAMTASGSLWLEITDADDPASMQPLMLQLGTDPTHPLSTKLTKDELAKVDDVSKKAGLPHGEADIEPLRPWLAAISLSLAPIAQAGYDPKTGVELTIKPLFVTANKPVRAFETMSQQLHFFADLPQQAEVNYLMSTVREFDEGKARLDALVNAWYTGDQAALDKLMDGNFRNEYPDLYKKLLVDRNATWMPKLTELLKGNETVFVAVGAGHLVGPDGIVALLQKAGYKVEQQ
jgi:uncharacterized protein YbaP (TraB family)